MRKKRVLALLLAFSMAVSTNGMTVFATETGTEPVSAVMEAEPEETESVDEIEETTPESEDAARENGAEDPEKSGDDATETEDSETETEAPEEDGAENGDAQSEPDTSISEETREDAISDNTVEETEEEIVEEGHEIRLLSFTDETGMRVTYDANAAATYKYTVENGTLTAVTDENGKPLSGVVELAADQNITAIGEAFAGNTAITYVKLPAGVTSINDGAFKGCSSLKGIYLPNTMGTIGASAFESCTKMTQLAIPKNVKSIGARAFVGDTALFMVYMRDADYSSLVSIGDEAFKGCTALSKFCSDDAFVIPGNLETIGASAFEGCESIEDVNMNETVTTIGAKAFKDCRELVNVVLSSKLADISQEAFSGCRRLKAVTFKKGNKSIGASAFADCRYLGNVVFSNTIASIGDCSFQDCVRLISVDVPNSDAVYGENVFQGYPDGEKLTLISVDEESTSYKYYKKHMDTIKFISYRDNATNNYYKYVICISSPDGTDNQKLGTITVTDKSGNDPNKLNNNQGVPLNTELFISFKAKANCKMVTGSLKCNGRTLVANKDGIYSCVMEKGGISISAEFEQTSSGEIEASDSNISVELSNGATVDTNNEVNGAKLKVGQTTRIFLIDSAEKNKTIKPSLIRFTSKNTKVATVDAKGNVHAVKAGTTIVTATVKSSQKDIKRNLLIVVTDADVKEIKLKAVDYIASIVDFAQSPTGVETAIIDKTDVNAKGTSIRLKATIYDKEDDDTSANLKWSTSDKKVAELKSVATTTLSTENVITIPKGASGEATITVTATNSAANAEKKTVTQKFIISVVDTTPRLASSTLTINPNIKDGEILEIISSYNNPVKDERMVSLVENRGERPTVNFTLAYDESRSNADVKAFFVKPREGIDNKEYSLYVNVSDSYYIPIKIIVKSAIPNPKLTLDKKQPKINLFYANDGTEIKPVITGLGTAKIASYALEPLGTDEDAKLFTENFEIDPDTGVITQKSASMLYGTKNQKGKPVVSGYLVLSYQGYKSDVKTKLKITIPTQTVKPSYKLDRTADTFSDICGEQTIKLHLLDTKKKNEPVDLNDGFDVTLLTIGTDAGIKQGCTVTSDGAVEITTKNSITSGKVVLQVTNTSWASGQYFNYTYKINATSNMPKASLTATTVTMNPSYPEQVQTFTLKSNQKDTVFADTQIFSAKSTPRNKGEYEKLSVTYENGEGKVELLDLTVKNGTYTFVCDKVMRENTRVPINGVTLKVKVARGVPTVALKGTAAFNLVAKDGNGNYVETASLQMTSKNLAEGYELDVDETKATIRCTTRNYTDSASAFEWNPRNAGYVKNVWTGSLDMKLSPDSDLPRKSYTFTMEPIYKNTGTDNVVKGKAVKFTVKVYSGSISVGLTAKGKLNLVSRESEYTANNSIIYTPSFRNLKDEVVDAKIFDASGALPKYNDEESKFFKAAVLNGKIYVSPRPGAEIDNNKIYYVKIWMKLRDYRFDAEDGYGTWSTTALKIKTAQILPKIKADKSTVNLYLSNKNYETSFVISKSDVKAIGSIASVDFGKEDTKAYDSKAAESLEIRTVEQADGSLKVYLKPKDAVSYSCGSTNKVNMYVRFSGQGANTDGVKLTMNVRINK